jgi:non-specific serine/threonine protein kinase
MERAEQDQGVTPAPARHGPLPAPLTRFIGREREAAEVARTLAAARLLTLTGVGGCGKSRLALHVAAAEHERFVDGVAWVELAPLSDPALAARSVAAALGVREQAGRPLVSTLAGALQERCLLLVLDNCDHLLDACATLAEALLGACPRLTVLATSRQPLGVAGEVAWRVPSLDLPEATVQPTAATLAGVDAVRLFVDRARLVQPSFAVTDANADTVHRLCARLDGLPLAIELAAARLGVLSPDDILARLDDRFRLLTGGARTAPPRQQTLRATLDWSYDLLAPDEQVVFQRLAVFAGGWTLAAAETVCADATIAPGAVLDLLARLVDRSLVVAETGAGGTTHYRLPETLRQYAAERLGADAAAEATRRRHADCYLALAEAAAPHLEGRFNQAWLDQLEREHDNLRAALTWAADSDGAVALRLASALFRFWLMRGHFDEGRRWLETALAAGWDVAVPARVEALAGACYFAHMQNDFARASALAEEGMALAEALGDARLRARVSNPLGYIAIFQGDYPRARARFESNLAAFRAADDRWGIANTLNPLALVAWAEGDNARARALLDEAVPLWQALGNVWGTAWALAYLGRVAWSAGTPAVARGWHQESLARFRALGDAFGTANALTDLGYVARDEGEAEQAAEHFREALALARDLGDRWGMALSLDGLAGVLAAGGQAPRAARLFAAAAAARAALGTPVRPPYRGRLEQDIAAARASLPADAFAASWAAGQAAPLSESVADALAATGPALPDRPATALVSGSLPLTQRETEVLRLLAEGLSDAAIARRLSISVKTVGGHVANILGKLDCPNRTAAAAVAVRHGLA